MKPIYRVFCAILDHNWRVEDGLNPQRLKCARCGAVHDVTRVPTWYRVGPPSA